MNNLQEKYNKEIVKELQKELGIKNIHTVPGLEKIVINIGLGEAVVNPQAIEIMEEELKQITGQKPIVTKSRSAISNFKTREGDKIGLKITLRRKKMWDFIEKLITVVLPRVKDFRGVSPKSFDGEGNYSLGMSEQTVFPEIDLNKLDKLRGFQIIIVTTARSDEHGYKLLEKLGMPFAKEGGAQSIKDIEMQEEKEKSQLAKKKKSQREKDKEADNNDES